MRRTPAKARGATRSAGYRHTMLSTFVTYQLYSSDMQRSLDRVAADPVTKREAEYYKSHIGQVKSVDEFLDDYRLYSYAMKAYGLEDQIYSKALMKKVLESDLNDTKSFANKLSDDRYREFAKAFSFPAASKADTTLSRPVDPAERPDHRSLFGIPGTGRPGAGLQRQPLCQHDRQRHLGRSVPER